MPRSGAHGSELPTPAPPRPDARSPEVPGSEVPGSEEPASSLRGQKAESAGPAKARARARSGRTIRFRLTMLYAGLFLACGTLLLLVSFLLVRQSLMREEGTGSTNQRVTEVYGYSDQQVRFFTELKVPPAPNDSERARQANTIEDVIVGVQQDIRNDSLHQLVVGSSIALGVMLVLSVIVGWVASGRALRPVGRLTARAQRLSEDNLHERIELDGPRDELTELADTLDGMLGRLEESFNAQRRFAASVSHEVRTPLAIMRGEADLALADPDCDEREKVFALSVRNNVDRTEALLESLLALSRSQSTMSRSETVDLAELTGDVVSQRVEAAGRARVRVELGLDNAVVDGDPWLLERLVANLVDNAITHNVRGGWLDVQVGTCDGSCFVQVSSTGERLTRAQLEGICQPFRRATDHRRPGHGLGMTIVQSVAQAHGGTVKVAPRHEGGLDVVVELPSRCTT